MSSSSIFFLLERFSFVLLTLFIGTSLTTPYRHFFNTFLTPFTVLQSLLHFHHLLIILRLFLLICCTVIAARVFFSVFLLILNGMFFLFAALFVLLAFIKKNVYLLLLFHSSSCFSVLNLTISKGFVRQRLLWAKWFIGENYHRFR